MSRILKAQILYIPVFNDDENIKVCSLVIIEFSNQRKEAMAYYYDFYNPNTEVSLELKEIIDDKIYSFLKVNILQKYSIKYTMLQTFKLSKIPNFESIVRDNDDLYTIKSVLLLCASLISCLVFHDISSDSAKPFKPPENKNWSAGFDFDKFINLIFFTVIHRNIEKEIDLSEWITKLIN